MTPSDTDSRMIKLRTQAGSGLGKAIVIDAEMTHLPTYIKGSLTTTIEGEGLVVWTHQCVARRQKCFGGEFWWGDVEEMSSKIFQMRIRA
jgi:hypothetical protein